MRLVIVRHGAAVPGGDSDASRVLQSLGHEQATSAGCWLESQNFVTPQVVSSPFVRAKQTADHICAQVGVETPLLLETLIPETPPELIVDWLALCNGDLILVSHLPLVGRLASLLVEGQALDQPWSPAECWILEGDIFAAGCMQVVAVWYPGCVE